MADKIYKWGGQEDIIGNIVYVFFCPGCKHNHPIEVPRWNWNGSFDKPTFTPSLLVNQFDPQSRCHCFIEEGMIQFLSDCYHELAGQTVEIPDWEKDREETWDH